MEKVSSVWGTFRGVTGNDFEKQKDLDIRNYAKYVLKEGSILEKREVLACLENKLVMRDKKIMLS